MSERTHVGEFEHRVMAAILHLEGDAYALPIRRKIEELGGRGVSRGALYTTLRRLEEKGYLESRLGDSLPQRGGRPRRYFSVTADGLAALRESRDELLGFWSGLERVLERDG